MEWPRRPQHLLIANKARALRRDSAHRQWILALAPKNTDAQVERPEPAGTKRLNPSNRLFVPSEILEEILAELPMMELLQARRVSRQFKDVICGSPKLQRTLFLRPGAAEIVHWKVSDWGHGGSFDLWWPPATAEELSQGPPEDFVKQATFNPLFSPPHSCDYGLCRRPVTIDESPKGLARAGALGRMLLCDPPATTACITACITGWSKSASAFIVTNKQGLTFNDIRKAIRKFWKYSRKEVEHRMEISFPGMVFTTEHDVGHSRYGVLLVVDA